MPATRFSHEPILNMTIGLSRVLLETISQRSRWSDRARWRFLVSGPARPVRATPSDSVPGFRCDRYLRCLGAMTVSTLPASRTRCRRLLTSGATSANLALK